MGAGKGKSGVTRNLRANAISVKKWLAENTLFFRVSLIPYGRIFQASMAFVKKREVEA